MSAAAAVRRREEEEEKVSSLALGAAVRSFEAAPRAHGALGSPLRRAPRRARRIVLLPDIDAKG